MSVQRAWEKFLQDNSGRLLDGDIEHQSPQGTFRGPISSITISEEKLIIGTRWTARLYVDRWEAVETRVFQYPITELPWPNSVSKKWCFFKHDSSSVALHLTHEGNLDPNMVEGLKKN